MMRGLGRWPGSVPVCYYLRRTCVYCIIRMLTRLSSDLLRFVLLLLLVTLVGGLFCLPIRLRVSVLFGKWLIRCILHGSVIMLIVLLSVFTYLIFLLRVMIGLVLSYRRVIGLATRVLRSINLLLSVVLLLGCWIRLCVVVIRWCLRVPYLICRVLTRRMLIESLADLTGPRFIGMLNPGRSTLSCVLG